MEARVMTFMFLSGSGRALHSGREATVGSDGSCVCVGGMGTGPCFIAGTAICSPADIWQEDKLPWAELLDYDRVVVGGLGS